MVLPQIIVDKTSQTFILFTNLYAKSAVIKQTNLEVDSITIIKTSAYAV